MQNNYETVKMIITCTGHSMHLHVCFEAVVIQMTLLLLKAIQYTVCVFHVPGCGSVVSPGPLTSDY